MTPPMWDFEIDPEPALKIALILANWGMVDNQLGHLIQSLSGITDTRDGIDLVHVLGLKKKIEILTRRYKRGRMTGVPEHLMKELAYIGEAYYADRNILAHGIIGGGGRSNPIVFSHTKLKTLPLAALDSILSEARYAAHVAHYVYMFGLGAQPAGEMPPRPPERPVPP